jgi:hypothetical protein
VGGWVGGRESRVKDCLQQSKIKSKQDENKKGTICKDNPFCNKTTFLILPVLHTTRFKSYLYALKLNRKQG